MSLFQCPIFIRVLFSSNSLEWNVAVSCAASHTFIHEIFCKVKTRILRTIQPLPPLPPPSPPPQYIGHRCIITHARTSSCRAIRHAISVWSSSKQCVASESYIVTVRVPFGGFRLKYYSLRSVYLSGCQGTREICWMNYYMHSLRHNMCVCVTALIIIPQMVIFA